MIEKNKGKKVNSKLYNIKKDEKALTIKDYAEIFWRRKWWFIVPVFLGVSLATLYSYSLPPVYRSSTLILVEPQKIPESYVHPTVTSSVEERLNTISQQILSRTNLEKIISEFGLYRAADASPASAQNAIDRLLSKGRKIWGASEVSQRTASGTWSPGEHVDRMRQSIEINVLGGRKQKNAFTISYSGKDPNTVMSVTNALASLFIEENLKVRERQAEGTSEFLTSELTAVEKNLKEVEKNLKSFKEKHNGSLPDQLEANLKTLDRFYLEHQNVSEEIRKLEERKIFYEQQISNYSTPSNINNNKESNSGKGILDGQLKELQLKLSRLNSEFTENYPDISIVKEQIRELEERISENVPQSEPVKYDSTSEVIYKRNNETKGQIQLVGAEIDALKDRKNKISGLIKEYERRVDNTYNNEMELFSLTRDYDISKQNYETLLAKKINAKMSENLEKKQQGEQFRILDPANMPTKPYMPNRMKITLIGSLCSGVVSAGLILLLEYLYPYFRRPEDFQNTFSLPLLSTIQRCRTNIKGKDYGIESMDHPDSIITEQYRVLYTKLNDINENSEGKVFAITSSIRGEGKTLTALNLSIVMARDFGKKTLLLEGDFKTPSLIKFIKQELQSDLVDILLSKTHAQSTSVPFADTLIPFANDKLAILPAAKSVNNSSGLVSSQGMKQLLRSLKEQYDFVLIDAPPILPLSDMNVFEEVVDGIILIVRAEKSPKGALIKAFDALASDKILGFVLNDFRQPLPRYYQGGFKITNDTDKIKVNV
jgi:polysaccharide chain length determinant protein (PEP-CTERM system associated)